jgi:hypothetical protein
MILGIHPPPGPGAASRRKACRPHRQGAPAARRHAAQKEHHGAVVGQQREATGYRFMVAVHLGQLIAFGGQGIGAGWVHIDVGIAVYRLIHLDEKFAGVDRLVEVEGDGGIGVVPASGIGGRGDGAVNQALREVDVDADGGAGKTWYVPGHCGRDTE